MDKHIREIDLEFLDFTDVLSCLHVFFCVSLAIFLSWIPLSSTKSGMNKRIKETTDGQEQGRAEYLIHTNYALTFLVVTAEAIILYVLSVTNKILESV